jgi:hypothetical protein
VGAAHGRVAPTRMEKGFRDEEDGGNSEKGREKMREGVEGKTGGVEIQKRTVSR